MLSKKGLFVSVRSQSVGKLLTKAQCLGERNISELIEK